jgi:LmbE family N-acetylglucosaminyl deacetylase
LVIVAPHPDDEVLAAGGLMRWMASVGREIVVVAVTDGEASHARSARVTPDVLRERRAGERVEALARLGVPDVTLVRLAEPDGACTDRVPAITAAVGAVLRPGDAVVGPALEDPHPDHIAVASALRRVAGGASIWEAPTWALVHRTAPSPTCVLVLDDGEMAAKRHAVRAYRSQLEPLGPDPLDGPVVHPHELAAMLAGDEQFRAVTGLT